MKQRIFNIASLSVFSTMDSLTQIAVGIATVEACAGKELKNKSLWVGALLGTLPDLDVWVGTLFSYETELAFHRSFTHSFLGVLLLSPLLAWIFRCWLTQLTFKQWTLTIAAALVTHTVIDLFTSWGVQLLYPFANRFSFKTIFVVDLFYTIPWVICLALLYRKKDILHRHRWLKRGFLFSSMYLLLTVMVKCFVMSKVTAAIKQEGITTSDYIVKPTISNILLWNINVQTPEAFYLGDYSLLDKQPIRFTKYAKNVTLEDSLLQFKSVQKLAEVSERWFTITPYQDSTYAFNDLRFGVMENQEGTHQFVFAYELVHSSNQIIVRPLPKTLRDGKEAFRKVWVRLKGN